MWRRVYLLLIAVRLYFAFSPSYIHPDEHFQGPEVTANEIFGWKTLMTWEFTSDRPIRSVFPLSFAFALPMQVVDWMVPGPANPSSSLIYYTLRLVFFLISFVLVDWAVQELVQYPKHRRFTLLLLASSYVTWTHQSHTFSNSIETVLVVWSLVLIQRIKDAKDSAILSSALLGFLAAFGVFTRITYPAFVLVPGLSIVPCLFRKPLGLISLATTLTLTSLLAIFLDTTTYLRATPTLTLPILNLPLVITPLNNLLYNSSTANLALHGIHPFYAHFLINLPQLLGPALLLLPRIRPGPPLIAALSGTFFLSLLPHQEARFLLPTIPLFFVSITPFSPRGKRAKAWIAIWLIFNLALGTLFGVFHQGGVVPAQLHLSKLKLAQNQQVMAVWWKTYQPPTWLLGNKAGRAINTVDLMGASRESLVDTLGKTAGRCGVDETDTDAYLVAPRSAVFLDQFVGTGEKKVEKKWGKKEKDGKFELREEWTYRRHLNLDDLDFGDDGVGPTIDRVWGRRGIVVWKVCRV
ncbi:hypothetical protein BJ508DRAFT_416264 [Ascobolus immersus RN42]|uniref:Mannosyltransferase n=1 Tax=Ascobolus immersus RN42 TaxID=1160509 RepID=A0A3N4I495_ASCIM|nr:hypothetical protein BJ508DRAFT_416264 [Ascobolus immersus RN42]